MSIYVEESVAGIERLSVYCQRILEKFENAVPAADILKEVDELEDRIEALLHLLPEGISLGDWERKIHFLRLFLRQNQPDRCVGDLALFIDKDIPQAIEQVKKWGGSFAFLDKELREKLAPLVGAKQFNAAIRAAFVLLTERIRANFRLPGNLDGAVMVNNVFGSRSNLTPDIDDPTKQAIRDYLAGAYSLLRNKYAHSDPPTDLAELEASIATVNLALRLVDQHKLT